MPVKTKPQTTASPVGEFGFSHLVKPSQFGFLDVELLLEGEEAEKLKEKFSTAAEEARLALTADAKNDKERNGIKAATLNVGFSDHSDKEGNATGKTVFKFKTKPEGQSKSGEKFTIKVPIVDAKNKPLINPKIGRGTRGKVAYQLIPYYMPATKSVGISLRLKAVRILELVEYGSDGVDAFGGEEEGYEAPDPSGDDGASSGSDF